MTDEELKLRGVEVLFAALGAVEAERFVSLLSQSPFDYTKWQTKLWPDASLEALSQGAMALRRASDSREADGAL